MERIRRLVGVSLLLIAVAIGVAACQIGPLKIVNGSGNVQSERRTVRDLNEVEIRDEGTLVIEQGTTEALTIEAEDNILPVLTSAVEDGRLILATRDNTTIRATRPIRYRLTVKELRAIRVSGSGDVESANLQADRLEIAVSGSGDVAIGQLTAARLMVDVSGSGNIELAGMATAQKVMISGSSDYRAEDLASKTATIRVSGSGNTTVRVSDTLDARVSGSGDIAYIGKPQVTGDSSGSGRVRQQAER